MKPFHRGASPIERVTARRGSHGRGKLGIESLEDRALLSSGLSALPGQVGHLSAHATEIRSLVHSRQHSLPGANTTTGGVRALMNLVYLNAGGRQEHLDLYLPTGPTPPGGHPVVLALPGGGWRWVRRNDLGVTVSELAKYGYVVAVADYAYASSTPGSHVWPTNFEDVQQAVRWLKTNAGRFGIDPNKVAVWGESAGGHLANLLGTYPDGPSAVSAPKTSVSARVEAVIDFYGPTDLTKLYAEDPKDRPYLQTFLGGSPDQYPSRYQDASPINHVTPAAPPFLIFQGTADTANLPDQSAELDQALTSAGVPHQIAYFDGVGHGFRLVPGRGFNLLPQILAFLDTSLNHPRPSAG